MNIENENSKVKNRYRDKLQKMPTNKRVRESQSIIKRDNSHLPEKFDPNFIITRIEELRNQPTALEKYFYRLSQNFKSEQEIKLIEQWKRQVEAGISVVNTLIEAEQVKERFYRLKKEQEIIDKRIEQEKAHLIAKGEADIKEQQVRAGKAELELVKIRKEIEKINQPEGPKKKKRSGEIEEEKRKAKVEKVKIDIGYDLSHMRLEKFEEIKQKILEKHSDDPDFAEYLIDQTRRMIITEIGE